MFPTPTRDRKPKRERSETSLKEKRRKLIVEGGHRSRSVLVAGSRGNVLAQVKYSYKRKHDPLVALSNVKPGHERDGRNRIFLEERVVGQLGSVTKFVDLRRVVDIGEELLSGCEEETGERREERGQKERRRVLETERDHDSLEKLQRSVLRVLLLECKSIDVSVRATKSKKKESGKQPARRTRRNGGLDASTHNRTRGFPDFSSHQVLNLVRESFPSVRASPATSILTLYVM